MSISIIIPAYNEEKLLGSCLRSCFKHAPESLLEIIVVNNASTDGTARVAREFPGVRVVNEPRKGTGFARQKGFESAHGDVLVFFDADTYVDPQWFPAMEKEFKDDSLLASVSGPCRYYDLSAWKSAAIYYCNITVAFPSYWQSGFAILGGNFAVRRNKLEEIGGFDTSIHFYGDDTDIARRLHTVGKVKFSTDFCIFASARRLRGEGIFHVYSRYFINHISQALWQKSITKGYGERPWEHVAMEQGDILDDVAPPAMQLRVMKLKDGRTLEFAEYGDLDADPLFYFHGFLGSCYQASLAHAMASKEGMRIIAPNRPGIGKSTPKLFANMTEYADDIEQLAAMLEIEQFAICGSSAGGSFAMACAYALPDRIEFLGLVSGMAPLSSVQNWKTMHWLRRYTLSLCENWPTAMAVILRVVFAIGNRYPHWLFERIMTSCPVLEIDKKQQMDIDHMFWMDFKSVFLQENGIRGLIDEAHLFFNWGFDIEDFPKNIPVTLWHGTDDVIVPWLVSDKLSRSIQLHRTVLFIGGHMAFLSSLHDIFMGMKFAWQKANATPALPSQFAVS